MRTEVILLALLVILGLQNTIKPIGIDAEQVLECEGKPADIAFIIDSSRSIYPPDFDKGIAFLQNFVKIFQIGPDNVRIAAVSFGQRVITDSAFGFDQHNGKNEVLQALKRITFRPMLGGSTNTAAAIIHARKKFFINARPNVKKIAIVLTDGRSDNFRKTKAEADRLKSQGVDIITIGVGSGAVEKELKAIASYDEDVFKVNSYGALKDIKRKLGLITCKAITTPAPTTTTTTTQPPKTEPCDGQAIDLNSVFDPTQLGTTGTDDTIRFIKTVVSAEDLNNGKVRVGTITGPCRDTKDIAFIIDSSRSIYAPDFDKGIDFLQNFVKIFKIGPDNVRIAAVSFGERVITDSAFGFDQHNEKNEVLQALKNITFRPELGGRTKTAMALKYARENFFTNARPNVKKIVIVLSDGRSDNFDKTKAEADLLKSQGVEITAMGVGKDSMGVDIAAAQEELKAISSYDKSVSKVIPDITPEEITHKLDLMTCRDRLEPDAGNTEPDAGNTEPDAGNTEPDAGNWTEPDAK